MYARHIVPLLVVSNLSLVLHLGLKGVKEFDKFLGMRCANVTKDTRMSLAEAIRILDIFFVADAA
jgi:hypothetical protein